MKTPVNILHLSDIHHFIPNDKVVDTQLLNKIKNGLFNKLAEISESKPIDVILITGDLTWSGQSSEYIKFKNEYLGELLKKCKFADKAFLITCPGNHDLNRKEIASHEITPEDLKDKELLLQNGFSNLEDSLFQQYASFIDNLTFDEITVPSFSDCDETKRCSGRVEIKELGLRFFITNSSWFAFGKEEWKKILPAGEDFSDQGKLILGKKNIVMAMREYRKEKSDFIHIGLMHHPYEFLAESEVRETGLGYEGPPFFLFATNMHCIFCGHTHLPFSTASLLFNQTQLFCGGAALEKNGLGYNGDPVSLRVGFFELFQKEKMIIETSILYFPDINTKKYSWTINWAGRKKYLLYDNDNHLDPEKNSDDKYLELVNDFVRWPSSDCTGINIDSIDWICFYNDKIEKKYTTRSREDFGILLNNDEEQRMIIQCCPEDFFSKDHQELVTKYLGNKKIIINLIEFEHDLFKDDEIKDTPSLYNKTLFMREVSFNKLKNKFEANVLSDNCKVVYTFVRREDSLAYHNKILS